MEQECKTCKYFKQIVNKKPCKSCYIKEGLPSWEFKGKLEVLIWK